MQRIDSGIDAAINADLNTHINVDVLIVGAGVVGLSTAALLAELGLSIAIAERGTLNVDMQQSSNRSAKDYDLRVSAINLASMQLFKHIGIAQNILATRASPYEKMAVWDANSQAKIDFHAADINQIYLGYIIENSLIINELINLVNVKENITIFAKTKLKSFALHDSNITANFTDQSINCQLMIGADGQHSAVRNLAKMPAETALFNQSALVCRIQTEKPHEQTAFQCFHHGGPIAYLPLADGSTSIVWSCDTELTPELTALNDKAFAHKVAEAMQHQRGKVEIISPRAAFPLSQQHSKRYIDQRVALVGDAAHRTHPLAGLGLNIGLQDAATLAEEIAQTLQKKRPFYGQGTLNKYQRRRKHQNALTLGAMQGFKTAFGSHDASLSSARVIALNAANQIAPLKSMLSRIACGVSGDLPQTCRPQYT